MAKAEAKAVKVMAKEAKEAAPARKNATDKVKTKAKEQPSLRYQAMHLPVRSMPVTSPKSRKIFFKRLSIECL